MAFTASRYVEDAGGGHYRVVWDGQVVYDGDLAGAQAAFNQWQAAKGGAAQPAVPAAPTTGAVPPLGTGGNTSWTDPTTQSAQHPGAGNIPGLIDAVTYGNTQTFAQKQQELEAKIADANRTYMLARNADERAAALQNLTFWQAEQTRITTAQNQYLDLAKTLLQAATTKSSQPQDYFQANKMMAGGRDIFQQASGGAAPAFSAESGRAQPGDISDILARLGVPAFKQTSPYTGPTGTGGSDINRTAGSTGG